MGCWFVYMYSGLLSSWSFLFMLVLVLLAVPVQVRLLLNISGVYMYISN